MNNEEKIERVRCGKRFFLIMFFASFVLLMLSSLLCIVFHDSQVQMVEKFFDLDCETYSLIVVSLLGLWKILIIQFTLLPAIALWIIEKTHCCCKGK